jgi:alpha-ketoglutaric semialdehyde dehydrogenase
MGSVNPLFILPGAMHARSAAIASGLQNSFTLGSGQFCTKPGLVFIPQGADSESFVESLKAGVQGMPPQTMLTSNIAGKYAAAVLGAHAEKRRRSSGARSAG